MWLVMFQPYHGQLVPQALCRSEAEARDFIEGMPWNAYGGYSYCFVPVTAPLNQMIYIDTRNY